MVCVLAQNICGTLATVLLDPLGGELVGTFRRVNILSPSWVHTAVSWLVGSRLHLTIGHQLAQQASDESRMEDTSSTSKGRGRSSFAESGTIPHDSLINVSTV
mmetsp:Transcript_26998/g.71005  ORF Transcript_26998/g.71005 Transcript_26998/m.71005 type:complete len:103 (+) Transcript_26998:132-440(+)